MPTVLHVTPYLHPSAGGPVVVALEYARHQTAAGYRAPILTTDWCSAGGAAECVERYGNRFDLTVLETGGSYLRTLRAAHRARVHTAVEAADIVHVHGLWHAPGALAMGAAGRLGRPYVVSPHGMLDPWSLAQGRWKKRLYLGLLEGRNLGRAACLLFTTGDERRLATETVGLQGRSEVVLLGADDPPTSDQDALRVEALRRFPALRGRRPILFFGRLHEKKRLLETVRIFREVHAKMGEAMLLVVGDGDPVYVGRVRAEVESLGLAGDVLFTGLLEGRDKWAAVSAADVFVLPSRQENFALAVAEVMKAGVPVVVSDKVNLAPHLQRADAGRVLPLEPLDDWVHTLAELLQNESETRALAERGRRLALAEFDWGVSARRVAAIYDDLLGRRADGEMA